MVGGFGGNFTGHYLNEIKRVILCASDVEWVMQFSYVEFHDRAPYDELMLWKGHPPTGIFDQMPKLVDSPSELAQLPIPSGSASTVSVSVRFCLLDSIGLATTIEVHDASYEGFISKLRGIGIGDNALLEYSFSVEEWIVLVDERDFHKAFTAGQSSGEAILLRVVSANKPGGSTVQGCDMPLEVESALMPENVREQASDSHAMKRQLDGEAEPAKRPWHRKPEAGPPPAKKETKAGGSKKLSSNAQEGEGAVAAMEAEGASLTEGEGAVAAMEGKAAVKRPLDDGSSSYKKAKISSKSAQVAHPSPHCVYMKACMKARTHKSTHAKTCTRKHARESTHARTPARPQASMRARQSTAARKHESLKTRTQRRARTDTRVHQSTRAKKRAPNAR